METIEVQTVFKRKADPLISVRILCVNGGTYTEIHSTTMDLSIRHNDGETQAQAHEDQSLIAAAPELLEALRELAADKYLSDPINNDRMAKARAAIAKAVGHE